MALPAEFVTGKAGDPKLAEFLDKIRAGNPLSALSAVSMTSKSVVEMAAVGLRAEGFPERVTVEQSGRSCRYRRASRQGRGFLPPQPLLLELGRGQVAQRRVDLLPVILRAARSDTIL